MRLGCSSRCSPSGTSPHRIRSYHDSAYDGIFQAQKGWGVVLAPPEYQEEIQSIYQDLPLGEAGEAEEKKGEAE